LVVAMPVLVNSTIGELLRASPATCFRIKNGCKFPQIKADGKLVEPVHQVSGQRRAEKIRSHFYGMGLPEVPLSREGWQERYLPKENFPTMQHPSEQTAPQRRATHNR